MFRNRLLPLCLSPFLLCAAHLLPAQCAIDSTLTDPGIYPARLPEACAGQPYETDLQVVVPLDTAILGFTVFIDSFQLIAVNNLPAGLDWECFEGAPECRHATGSPEPIRSCLRLFGTPAGPTAPGDSIEIFSRLWVTVPFVGLFTLENTVRKRLRVNSEDQCSTSVTDASPLRGLQVYPQPLLPGSRVFFELTAPAGLRLLVRDAGGRLLLSLYDGRLPAGRHALPLSGLNDRPPGVYFLQLTLPASGQTLGRPLLFQR